MYRLQSITMHAAVGLSCTSCRQLQGMLQVWIQKYDEEMGAAEATYQEELAQTNQVNPFFFRGPRALSHELTLSARSLARQTSDCALQGMPSQLYAPICACSDVRILLCFMVHFMVSWGPTEGQQTGCCSCRCNNQEANPTRKHN